MANKSPSPTSSSDHLSTVNADLKARWQKEQLALAAQMVLEDRLGFAVPAAAASAASGGGAAASGAESSDALPPLRYMGGVDISFVKGSDTDACASLVIVEYPSMEVVHEQYEMVKLEFPYIAGYLAFREVDHLVKLVNALRDGPDARFTPQIIFVDGQGTYHYRKFGLACHLGVLVGIPTVGCGKSVLFLDGISKAYVKRNQKRFLLKAGDSFDLVGDSGYVYGSGLRATEGATNALFVSPGHLISHATALHLCKLASTYRVPEPVRRADLGSRSFLKRNWPPVQSE